jgi:hypothetical protein
MKTFEDTYPSVPPACCNGNCDQGRRCPARQAAEAATEVGTDNLDQPVSRWAWIRDLALVAAAIGILYALLEGSLS